MGTLRVEIKADNRGGNNSLLVLQALVSYQRIVRAGGKDENGNQIPDEVGPRERYFALPENIDTSISMSDYAEDTKVSVAITDAQGSKLVSFRDQGPTKKDGQEEWRLAIALKPDVVKRLVSATKPNPPDTRLTISARAEFKPTIDVEIDFKKYVLVVSPISNERISSDMRSKFFGDQTGVAVSSRTEATPNAVLSEMKASSANDVPLSMQGQFEFTVPALEGDDAWLWVLSGPHTFLGLVAFDEKEKGFRRVLWLPLTKEEAAALGQEPEAHGTGIPVDPSEQELIESPELFADDPGTKCKPFSSPFRIVGERTFHTVLRVTQPEISTDAAAPQPPRPFDIANLFDLDTSEFVLAASTGDAADPSPAPRPMATGRLSSISNSVMANLSTVKSAINTLVPGRSGKAPLTPAGRVLAAERAEVLKKAGGRRILNADDGLDWEDNTPLQAASLSYGHVLDYRVRWRNNGYSLGDVLYSLALAPRQTKQIMTVQSEITDRAVRTESTTVTDEIAQGTTREYGYTDAVEAGLSEWAKGGSKSSNTGVAGGIGVAVGPVVLGGGASHGRAESSSWQQGGRKVTGIEEQQLRDAIRQYGESVRKLETVVVQEQSQEETTRAVSETVRNPNYCHSLTIVYHEILRHLRVDTEVVGARECVFVPLPIRPFDWTRMIRWRDSITRALLRPRLRWVMPYLEDIRNKFIQSDIPDGMRAEQPIRFLSGSVYVRLAVERPEDPDDDGVFDRTRWISLMPFVNRPVREIFERLKRNAQQKDEVFQRDYAPGIAAKWLDKLTVQGSGQPLETADFTLASKYRYGRTVRVDFTYVPDQPLTRKDLIALNFSVDSNAPLPPGSVANVQRVKIRYTTDDFERKMSSASAEHDLVKTADGSIDPNGADISIPLDNWEKNDQRKVIIAEANKLRKHLNEHLEYYHKYLWWNLDRDKLYMLLDTVYAQSEADGRSVASVVERNPIAILGNNLVYRVAGGAHLGIDGHSTAQELNSYYRDSVGRSEPIRVSLPTSGVYAQALLDDCEACEEHFGSTEWILSDKEPELVNLDPSLLSSRRADAPDLSPTTMPNSIINLQNAPNVPPPSGFAGAFGAVTSANAFRDMAGLEGTQANAKAAMESAASLASTFGTQAAEIRKAEIAARVAKEKLAVVKKAKDSGAVSEEKGKETSEKIVDDMANDGAKKEETLNPENIDKVAKSADNSEVDIDVDQKKKKVTVKSRRSRKKKTGAFKVNVTVIVKDFQDDAMEGAWKITFGPIADIFNVSFNEPARTFSNAEFPFEGEVLMRLVGDPLLTADPSNLVSTAEQFLYSATAMISVKKGEDIVINVKQTRGKTTKTYTESKSETQVITDVMSSTMSVESGAIAALLAGKLKGSFTVSQSDSQSETDGQSESHSYTVFYPKRTLKIKQKGVETPFIDPDE